MNELEKVKELLRDAYDHLNYCNYGDAYERECSAHLRDELDEYFNPGETSPERAPVNREG